MMQGIAIAIGEVWQEIAQKSCDQMAKMTGIPCAPLTMDFDNVHPSWNKTQVLNIFDGTDGILLFDIDIISLRPWDPVALWEASGRAFMACPDRNNERVEDECSKYDLPFPNLYINAGLTIFGREHKPIWDAVRAMHPFEKGWLEQTPLNMKLIEYERAGGNVVRLDRKYNQIVGWQSVKRHMAGDTVNAHIAGNGGCPERILAAQKEAGL